MSGNVDSVFKILGQFAVWSYLSKVRIGKKMMQRTEPYNHSLHRQIAQNYVERKVKISKTGSENETLPSLPEPFDSFTAPQ